MGRWWRDLYVRENLLHKRFLTRRLFGKHPLLPACGPLAETAFDCGFNW
jgi:hypothetical protein